MPTTRRTLDEQLETLKQKKEAIEKQLNAVEKRKHETDRKLETRRKIIVGGAVIAHAEIDQEFRRAMQVALQKAVAPKDRALVGDLIRTGLTATPASPSLSSPLEGNATAAAKESPPPPTRSASQSTGKGPPATEQTS
jgi:hypothetical protein